LSIINISSTHQLPPVFLSVLSPLFFFFFPKPWTAWTRAPSPQRRARAASPPAAVPDPGGLSSPRQ
jgi:hypothetical protein